MIIQKKGLSPVVATVAVIMLTLVAAGFIAGVVVPLIKNQLNDAKECFGYEEYFTFYEEFEYNCYINISTDWLHGVSIKAKAASGDKVEQVKGFNLQFMGSGESIAVTVENGTAVRDEIRMLKLSKTFLEVPKQGEVKTYVYNGTRRFDSVEVFPLLKSGRVCEGTSKIDLRGERCHSSVDLEIL
ncbi:MAG: archaellin/type IV pilin N-terminal domain-containing protein [Nanoarchaeota archaeon]